MSQILRQSTAIDVRLGPFVDVGDGFTPEAGVTLAAANEKAVLKANGAAVVTMAGAFAAVSSCDGYYDYTASAGDLDTCGDVTFVMQEDATYLPVKCTFQVVEEEVYDALFAASAVGFLKAATPGNDLLVDGTGRIDVGSWLGTAVTLSASAPDVNIQSTDDIDLSATQKASVATEISDALTVDTIAELTQQAPVATPTIATALMLPYMALRNKLTTTDSELGIYNDAGTKIAKAAIADAAGTFTRDEMISGA